MSGLDKIQSDGTTVDDCLVLALQRWLKSDDTSWTVLVTAIFRPAGGGNQRLAAEVAGSYRGIIYVCIVYRIMYDNYTCMSCMCRGDSLCIHVV